MSFSRALVLVAIAVTMFLMGCSGGSSPVSPDQNKTQGTMDNLPIIGMSEGGGQTNAIGLLGAYELQLNADTLTADLVSQRTPALGESYIVSGINFFTLVPCANCLKLSKVIMEAPYVKLTFDISHPFAPGDPALPPTGKNRLDLDIFDVAMVIVPVGGSAKTFSVGTAYTDVCAKADGYTTELSNMIVDDAACPYYLVIDDSEGTASTYNKFAMGTKNALFDVYFDKGGQFNMFLTFGYGKSAQKKADRFTPIYYNPEFNRKSSWKVSVLGPEGTDTPSRLNTWNDLDTDPLNVTVKVYDWQQGANADPLLTNTTDVYAASNVSKVSVAIPGMTAAAVTATTPTSGTGTPSDPLVYAVPVPNTLHLTQGKYVSLVKVEDERATMEVPPTNDRDFLINNESQGVNVNYKMNAYVTYQSFVATVFSKCGPITGTIDVPVADPLTGVKDGAFVRFKASAASANGGDPIATFEWDQDYDGTNFTVDKTGADVRLGKFENPNCGGTNDPVSYVVACRAVDSCDPPNVTMIGTRTVVVDDCTPGHIIPDIDIPIESGDTWWDICVQPGTYVYIVADHPATGNQGGSGDTGSRTALRFNPSLDGMEVINPGGTGLASPGPGNWPYEIEFHEMDVSDGGLLANNVGGGTIAPWTVSGTTATCAICCYAWNCYYIGHDGISDFSSPTYGTGVVCFGQASTYCAPAMEGWILGFTDSNPSMYNAYNTTGVAGWYADSAKIVSSQYIPGTENQYVFYSDDTTGSLNLIGPSWSMNYTLAIIQSTGTYGTNVGEFQGGLDAAVDADGNIITLENQAGVIRFQMFDNTLTWVWESPWIGSALPTRMDFDKSTGLLYVLTDGGASRCSVM